MLDKPLLSTLNAQLFNNFLNTKIFISLLHLWQIPYLIKQHCGLVSKCEIWITGEWLPLHSTNREPTQPHTLKRKIVYIQTAQPHTLKRKIVYIQTVSCLQTCHWEFFTINSNFALKCQCGNIDLYCNFRLQ